MFFPHLGPFLHWPAARGWTPNKDYVWSGPPGTQILLLQAPWTGPKAVYLSRLFCQDSGGLACSPLKHEPSQHLAHCGHSNGYPAQCVPGSILNTLPAPPQRIPSTTPTSGVLVASQPIVASRITNPEGLGLGSCAAYFLCDISVPHCYITSYSMELLCS